METFSRSDYKPMDKRGAANPRHKMYLIITPLTAGNREPRSQGKTHVQKNKDEEG